MYMTARSRKGKRMRAYHFRKDGGKTWTKTKFDKRLPEPSCQGSIIALKSKSSTQFITAWPSNPKGRTQLRVHVSSDGCKTWPISKVAYAGGSAYSDLAVTKDGVVLLAFEKDSYRTISLLRFNTAWLKK